MNVPSTEELVGKRCAPCEGGVPPLSADQVRELLGSVPGWEVTSDSQRIRRRWVAKHFMAAIEFFNAIAALAEQEGHHPDLHLESYRNVTVEVFTHAIGGLSENDFILAAKINGLPLKTKKSSAET